MGFFDELFFTGGDINGCHYGVGDYERYKRAVVRANRAYEKELDRQARREQRKIEQKERIQREDEYRRWAAEQKRIDAERREKLANQVESAKTERERIKQEAAIRKEELALEREERARAEKQRRIDEAQNLEQLAKDMSNERALEISNFAHPARRSNLCLRDNFDVEKISLVLAGIHPERPVDAKNWRIILDDEDILRAPLPLKSVPLPPIRDKITEDVLDKIGPGQCWENGRRKGGWWTPEMIEKTMTKGRFTSREKFMQQVQQEVDEKNRGLQEDIESVYLRAVMDYNHKLREYARENATTLLGVLDALKESVRRTERDISKTIADNQSNDMEYREKLMDWEKAYIDWENIKKEIQEDYSKHIGRYHEGDDFGVDCYIEASAAYALRDHATEDIQLIADWNHDTGEAIVDFILPRFEAPEIKKHEANHTSHSINDIPLEKDEIKEMIQSAIRELPIRIALEVFARDYQNKIIQLTVNAWYRGVCINETMTGIACQSSIQLTEQLAKGYEDSVSGFLRAVSSRISDSDDNPVEPFSTLVKDGILDYGNTMDRIEVLLRGFLAMENEIIEPTSDEPHPPENKVLKMSCTPSQNENQDRYMPD